MKRGFNPRDSEDSESETQEGLNDNEGDDSDRNDASKQKASSNEQPGPSKDNHGFRRNLHGSLYQALLTALLFYKAHKTQKEFSLRGEVEGLGKWDDIVFQIKNENEYENYFIQVKHAQDSAKDNTWLSKLSPEFLYSYRLVNHREEFQGKAKKFIVYTNKCLDENKQKCKEAKENDRVLDMICKGPRYMFREPGFNREETEFFEKLVFAVDQRNDDDLFQHIEEELSIEFNVNNSKWAASQLQAYILKWIKNKEEKPLTHEDANEFFDKLRGDHAYLQLVGCSMDYKTIINELWCDKVIKFLNEENYKMMNVICSKSSQLGVICVNEAVQHQDKYKKDDGFISLHLKSLLRLFKLVKKAFRVCDLLIVDCGNETLDLEKLDSEFLKIDGSQKIILITTEENQGFAEKIRDNNPNESFFEIDWKNETA